MRKRLIGFALAVAGVMTLGPVSSWAHHSMSMFDRDKEITLEGVVKEFQYTIPHAWLLIDVTNEDGTVTTWGFESSSRTALRLRGVRANTFQPGMKVSVTGNPMRDGRPAGLWLNTVTEDGTVWDVEGL